MKPAYLYFCLIACAFIACAGERYNVTSTERIQINEKLINPSFKLSGLTADLKLVKLDNRKEAQISEVYKIVQTGENYIFLDKYSASIVSMFSSDGSFVHSFGHKGTGPGEYVLPMDFTIDRAGNELLVLNSEEHKVNYYDLATGSYKRSKIYMLPFHDLYKTGNGFVLGGAAKESRLIFADSNFRPTDRFINFSQQYGSGIINKFFSVNDSLVTFRLSYNDTVFRILNDDIRPYLLIDFEDKRFGIEDFQRLNVSQKLRVGEYAADKMANIGVFAETNDTRIFTFDYKHKRYVCIQDKHSGHKMIFAKDGLDDDVMYLREFPTIVGADREGYFLFTVPSSRMGEALQRSLQYGKKGNGFLAGLGTVDQMSNPILGRIKIKKF